MVKLEVLRHLILLGVVKIVIGDRFSDLDKLDIDAQLRELDEMIDKLDDDINDNDLNFDAVNDFFSDDCTYKCKNGAKPVPKPGHVPTSNGCGSFGLTLDTSALPDMTKCCDKHDYCYDTCNQDRAKCDENFKQCLDDMCDKLKAKITKNQHEGCKETAKLIFGGTTALGCSPYLSAQEKACACPTGDKSRTSSNERPRTGATNNIKKHTAKPDKEHENLKDRNSKMKNKKTDRVSDVKDTEASQKSKPKTRNISGEL